MCFFRNPLLQLFQETSYEHCLSISLARNAILLSKITPLR